MNIDDIKNIVCSYDSLVCFKHGKEHCILPEHYDKLCLDIYNKINNTDNLINPQ